MTISYDDAVPDISDEMWKAAHALGWVAVHIVCDEQDTKPDDESGVAFCA
jgi:hypothetical protein